VQQSAAPCTRVSLQAGLQVGSGSVLLEGEKPESRTSSVEWPDWTWPEQQIRLLGSGFEAYSLGFNYR
jgi:hypothetical protein